MRDRQWRTFSSPTRKLFIASVALYTYAIQELKKNLGERGSANYQQSDQSLHGVYEFMEKIGNHMVQTAWRERRRPPDKRQQSTHPGGVDTVDTQFRLASIFFYLSTPSLPPPGIHHYKSRRGCEIKKNCCQRKRKQARERGGGGRFFYLPYLLERVFYGIENTR